MKKPLLDQDISREAKDGEEHSDMLERTAKAEGNALYHAHDNPIYSPTASKQEERPLVNVSLPDLNPIEILGRKSQAQEKPQGQDASGPSANDVSVISKLN
jgi:hypothetical protein